jgi:hypothetical protein
MPMPVKGFLSFRFPDYNFAGISQLPNVSYMPRSSQPQFDGVQIMKFLIV